MVNFKDRSPLILAVILYLLFYFIRFQQGGWDVQINLLEKERQFLSTKISEVLPSPQAELLSGILLGQKKDLPAQLRLALRDTSTLHIVVVSGQNLTLLAAFVMNLAGILNRRIAIGLTFILITFYTVLTGADIPVIRAALMAFLSYMAQLLGRRYEGIWVLIVVALFLLLINPLWILDISFQLSFLATFGVVVVSPLLLSIMKRVPEVIKEDLAITFGAQIMVTPIIVSNFHQLSLVGIFTNLLVLWTVPIVMIAGIILVILSLTWQFLAAIFAYILGTLLTYFIYIVTFFSSLPFAWQYIGDVVWLVWVGYYLILIGILIGLNQVRLAKKK